MIIESASPTGTSSVAVAPQRILLADVREDMAAIFGDGDALHAATPHRAQPIRKVGAIQIPGSAWRGAAGPIACAALGGLLLGMAAIGVPGLINRTTAPPRVAQPAITVTENPFESVAVTRPALLHRMPQAPPAAPSATVAGRLAAARVAPAMPTSTADERAPSKPAARSTETRASANPAPKGSQCEGDRLERHWCMRHDILEADRSLRLAYADAIAEGVERRYLVAHQRRWTRLRDRATRDPDAVLAGYRELAEDLRRLAINGRRRDRI